MAKQIKMELLKNELKERNISYYMVQRRTGISVSLLSLMLAGKRNMSVVKLNKSIKSCKISIDKIME